MAKGKRKPVAKLKNPATINNTKIQASKRSQSQSIDLDEVSVPNQRLSRDRVKQRKIENSNNHATIKRRILQQDIESSNKNLEAVHDLNVCDNRTTFVDPLVVPPVGDGIDVDVDPAEDQLFPDDGADKGANDNDLSVGESAQTSALLKDPELRNMFNKLFDERIKEARLNNKDLSKGIGKNTETGHSHQNRLNDYSNVSNQNRGPPPQPLIKSPSDTTLYTPALKRREEGGQATGLINLLPNTASPGVVEESVMNRLNEDSRVSQDAKNDGIDVRIMRKITDFLDALRVEYDRKSPDQQHQPASPEMVQAGPSSEVNVPGRDEAQRRSDNAIIEAEKFKASVSTPSSGKMLDGRSDEDFFYLMSHVDMNMRNKIERGEFVDLEKLLPRDKRNNFKTNSQGNKLQWVLEEGETFLAPAGDRDNKITQVKRWDQAFRVYATIYCGAHPDRSKEIWQYVDVIHTAAASFVWENVSTYDVSFQHLMEFNPQRSWSTTYNQMWNLCMKEHLPPRGGSGNGKTNNYNYTSGYSNNNNNGNSGGKKTQHGFGRLMKKQKGDDYCWNFNRGIPCKYGKNCRFWERCSYCDSVNHGLNTCSKAEKKEFHRKSGSGPPAAPSGN